MSEGSPTTVEWMDGETRRYVGYAWEINADTLQLTDPDRRPVVIPLATVREISLGTDGGGS